MIFQRIIAGILLVTALYGAFVFSYAQSLVAFVAIAIAAATFWQPTLVFALVAVILPAIDLTPWSGRCYFNEFDIWLLAAIGGATCSSDLTHRHAFFRIDRVLVTAVSTAFVVSIIIAFTNAQAMKLGHVNAYYHPLNALRAAKPLFYTISLGLLLWKSRTPTEKAFGLFAIGTTIGLANTVLLVIVERLRFCGLFNNESDFRVTGPFADMHVGGAALDTYLVMAIPLLGCVWWRTSKRSVHFLLLLLLLGAIYATAVTVSRAPIMILGVQTMVLSIMGWRRLRRVAQLTWQPVLVILLILTCIGAAVTTKPLRRRFLQTLQDFETRADHWRASYAMLDNDWQTQLFGIGGGGYAKLFQQHTMGSESGGYGIRREKGISYLRLDGSIQIYMGQYVSAMPNTIYRVVVNGRRQSGSGALAVSLVEKSMLYSYESARHRLQFLDIPNGQWGSMEAELNSGTVGMRSGRLLRRPIVFSLCTAKGTVIDVDSIKLLDDTGNNLIANGDFNLGHDLWWWTSDDHLIWHAQNLLVHLVVEQGWLGILAFSALTLRCLVLLSTRVNRGELDALFILVAFLGLLLMGVVDSVIDSPRIALLFFLMIMFTMHANQSQHATRDEK